MSKLSLRDSFFKRNIIPHTQNPPKTDLLLEAVKKNDITKIQELIAAEPSLINSVYPYPHYNTILYIAISDVKIAKVVKEETVQILIKLGADLFYSTYEDDYKQAIHYAAIGQNHSILKMIIEKLQEIDPNRIHDTTCNDETALSVLIKNSSPENDFKFKECLELLLTLTDIDVNFPDKKNQTPIKIAAKKRNKIAVTTLLDSKKTICIDDKAVTSNIENKQLYDKDLSECNIKYVTPSNIYYYLINNDEQWIINNDDKIETNEIRSSTVLQTACEHNLQRIVKYLLDKNDFIKSNAYKDTTQKNKKQPIEIAALNGFWEIFELLLSCYKLHDIPENVMSFTSAHTNSRIVSHLLSKESINLTNKNNKTNFLHTNQNTNTQKYFLRIQDVSPKTLERYFDDCITAKNAPCDNDNVIFNFNYSNIMPPNEKNNEFVSEMNMIKELIDIKDLRYLLKHPLISTFLLLRWHKINLFYYINTLFYFFFLVTLLLYIYLDQIIEVYQIPKKVIYVVLLICWAIFLIKEIPQVFISKQKYFENFENYVQIGLILTVGIIIVIPYKSLDIIDEDDGDFFNTIVAMAILLSALELLFTFGQDPRFSVFTRIFRSVSYNFFKLLLWSMILLVAFVLSFNKLFTNTKSNILGTCNNDNGSGAPNFLSSFLKIIIMLIGELDASNLDLCSDSHKLFLLIFIFVVPIILLSLLNSLAVSDTQKIKYEAEVFSYVQMVEGIIYIEDVLIRNIFLKTVNLLFKRNSLHKRIVNRICLFSNAPHKLKLYINMSDRRTVKLETNYTNAKKGFCKKLLENVYLDQKTILRLKTIWDKKKDMKDKDINYYVEQINNLKNTICEIEDFLQKYI
ncbi:transient receptor potential cation channel protein painless-like [Onthophagus taurus]|uniref:transient receptor potential cation channel protein painless-like n=1 Tax=Onthophagus taurus TaxID=166361 RepID=UPI0039BE7D75